ncbi:MAG: hypothetical protein NT062_20955 [Proteobacteria bacterium]|nr:hypothetical protein [Pseudomonadota bacterium]
MRSGAAIAIAQRTGCVALATLQRWVSATVTTPSSPWRTPSMVTSIATSGTKVPAMSVTTSSSSLPGPCARRMPT